MRHAEGMQIDELRNCLREGDAGRDEWNSRRRSSPSALESLDQPLTLALENNVRVALAPPNLWLADLKEVDLSGYDLSGAFLSGAHLEGANLRDANLSGAHLIITNLRGCDLRGADLSRANLLDADLAGANLSNSSLSAALMLRTNVADSILDHSNIHGVSTWGLKGTPSSQKDLVITTLGEPTISVDSIEVAQFVYLLLHNQKVREVIDTITSKVVLILGRFTVERKEVLDALREDLRRRDYLPILFDFEKPRTLDTDETITLLARMARFVIADISDAKSVLQELRAIVPDLPSLPVQPIILASQEEPGMFDFYRNRPSFLAAHRYADQTQLLADLGEKVIRPAELKALELRGRAA